MINRLSFMPAAAGCGRESTGRIVASMAGDNDFMGDHVNKTIRITLAVGGIWVAATMIGTATVHAESG